MSFITPEIRNELFSSLFKKPTEEDLALSKGIVAQISTNTREQNIKIEAVITDEGSKIQNRIDKHRAHCLEQGIQEDHKYIQWLEARREKMQ